MLGKPAESSGSSPSHRGAQERKRQNSSEPGRADEDERPGERFGPLTLTRRVKDDGRTLILYARAPEERA
jgi:hypothetical protein